MAQSRRTPLLSFVEARKEYLDLNVMAGLTEECEQFKKLSEATSSSIQGHVLALAGISPEDANLLISKILEMRLLAGHKQEIVGIINDKVWLAYQDPTEEPSLKQSIDEPEIFLTEDDWEFVRSPTSSMRDRVGRLAARCCSLGLWYPTETAVRNVVTLAFLDKGDPSSFMDVALQASRSYKALVRMRRTAHRGPRASLPNFQQSIQDFEANHPDWFGIGFSEAGPLVPVPVPTLVLRSLEAQLGCRNTKRGLSGVLAHRASKAVACPAATMSAPLTLQDFADFMMRQQVTGAAGLPVSGVAGLPGLRVFSPGSSSPVTTAGDTTPLPLPALPPAPAALLPAHQPAQQVLPPAVLTVATSPVGLQSPALGQSPSEASLEGDWTPSVAGLEVTPSLLDALSPLGLEGESQGSQATGEPSTGQASPGVAGPPVAPQASDLVARFKTMLQQQKPKENEEEELVASSKKTTKAKVLKKPAAAPALVAAPQVAPAALVAVPQNLVAGPQKRDADAFELPPGWTMRKEQRKSGGSAGKWDTYFFNPAGKRFRTQGEVMKALQA